MTIAAKTAAMNILLIEDHAQTRKEIASLINSEKDMRVVAEAATGEEGVQKAMELKPDVIVLDILLPGMSGFDVTMAILESNPGMKILILSNYSGQILVQTIMKAGGMGYIHKNRAFEELLPAIRAISAGNKYMGYGIYG